MEKLFSQVQKEISNKVSNKVRRVTRLTMNSVTNLSAEELCEMLENAPDPASIEALLSEEQRTALWKYQDSRREEAGQIMQQKMAAEKMHQRDVRSVLRVRLVDLKSPGEYSALLSWWQPPEDLLSLFAEGKALALFNISPGNSSNQKQVYLNSARHSRIEQLPTPTSSLPLRRIFGVEEISPNLTPLFGEIDVVGLVVFIHSVAQGSSKMQTVYLTDTGQNYFGLVFWRGLQEFSCEDILAEGLVMSASNVQWRRTSSTGPIPCGYVTETTLFAHNSKIPAVQTLMKQIKQDLDEEDIPTLIEKCQDDISTRLNSFKNQFINQSNISKSSILYTSDLQSDQSANTSTDSVLSNLASPHPRPRYLNGFAQKPQASSTPNKARTPIQRRIDKLQEFGEPPPLSPIPIPHRTKSSKAFKVPLSKNVSR